MKITAKLLRHGPILIGLILGVGILPARAQTPEPQLTPQPVTKEATALITAKGMACLDLDLNGRCATDETPVMNVIVRGSNDVMAVTDSNGRYSIQIPSGSDLDVTIPGGFMSVNGNLHHLRSMVVDSGNMDIALVKDDVATATGMTSVSSKGNVSAQGPIQELFVPSLGNVSSTAILAAFASIVLVSLMILIGVLIGLRIIYVKSVVQQNRALKDQQETDLRVQLQSARGWLAVAEQIVADALSETVSIDDQVGVLEAAVEPNPRFTIVTRDRRTLVFTTNPQMLKKARLMRRGDRVIDVTAGSSTNHTNVNVLWQHILALRNMYHVTLPSSAHWYIVAHAAGSSIAIKQKSNSSHSTALRGSWLSTLWGGR